MSVSAAVPRCPDFLTSCALPRTFPDGFASVPEPLGNAAKLATPPPSLLVQLVLLCLRIASRCLRRPRN